MIKVACPHLFKKELQDLVASQSDLINLASDTSKTMNFAEKYQDWYSRAIKLVESLAPERLKEFCDYYLIDPKRKIMGTGYFL